MKSMALESHGFHPMTLAVLRALRGGAKLSRNRHFSLFQDPRARKALRLHRYLESVVRDVRTYHQDLSVFRSIKPGHAGEYALRIEFPIINGHRTAYLRDAELRLLAEDAPEVAQLLNRRLVDSAG